MIHTIGTSINVPCPHCGVHAYCMIRCEIDGPKVIEVSVESEVLQNHLKFCRQANAAKPEDA